MKTTFVNGNPAEGIAGTVVTAEFLTALNTHRHTGRDVDGDGSLDYAADTGEANAYVVTLSPALDEYIAGMPIFFKAENANTGASTININGLGATSIKKNGSSDIEADDISAGQIVGVIYDGTYFQLLNPVIPAVPTVASVLGAFRNLQASASGTGTNVSVSADEIVVEDEDHSYVTLRSVSLTIGTAGSGANGLDTGSLAASTWYSIWVIYNPTTQTTAGLISTSASAPTLPSGYTYKSRVGWIRTDASANKYPLSFIQYGRKVRYKVASGSNVTSLPQLASGAAGSCITPTWVAVGVGNFVPSTAVMISIVGYLNTSTTNIILAPNNNYGGIGSTPPWILGIASQVSGGIGDLVLESSNIYWASSGSANLITCMGWEDNL